MMSSFSFGPFTLDPDDRQLRRGGAAIEINGRYFDALTLLVREQGRLVTKDRFMDEVWRGIPVTDEALTQCIKTLRRQLGDQAGEPRFIETVPKHGYRFIAPVEAGRGQEPQPATPQDNRKRELLITSGSGIVGGLLAGAIGGAFYGFAATAQPLAPGGGAISILLVLTCLTALVAIMGAAGVAFGIAAARYWRGRDWLWTIIGGAAGGMTVGASVKLLGTDAFNLLLGASPGNITGASEGALLGASIGLGFCFADRLGLRRGTAAAALSAGAAGIIIPLLGGRLMGGSLDLLARQFPHSSLRLDQIGQLFGESGFGPVSQLVTGCLEAMLFGGFVVGAMLAARRYLN